MFVFLSYSYFSFLCDFRSNMLIQYVKMKKMTIQSHTRGCAEKNDTKQGKVNKSLDFLQNGCCSASYVIFPLKIVEMAHYFNTKTIFVIFPWRPRTQTLTKRVCMTLYFFFFFCDHEHAGICSHVHSSVYPSMHMCISICLHTCIYCAPVPRLLASMFVRLRFCNSVCERVELGHFVHMKGLFALICIR